MIHRLFRQREQSVLNDPIVGTALADDPFQIDHPLGGLSIW
jgi:hypothetical protein